MIIGENKMKNKENIMHGIGMIIFSIIFGIVIFISIIDDINFSKSISYSIFGIISTVFVMSFPLTFLIIGIKLIYTEETEPTTNSFPLELIPHFKKYLLKLLIIGITLSIIINGYSFYKTWSKGNYILEKCKDALVTDITKKNIMIEYEIENGKKEEILEKNKKKYSNVKVGDYIRVHCQKEKKNTLDIYNVLLPHILISFAEIILITLNPIVWYIYIIILGKKLKDNNQL